MASYESTIKQAKTLYYSGKHNEAFSLLQHAIQQITQETISLTDDTYSHLLALSNELELTSLHFAVQSIFLHNISAQTTIELLKQHLSSQKSKEMADEIFIHDLYDLLGQAYYYQEQDKVNKDFNEADKYISKALLFRENTGSVKLPYSYFFKGLIHQYRGEINSALNSFNKANQISQQDPYLLSLVCQHLGYLLQQMGRLSEAKGLFEQSLQLRLDHSIMVYVPFSCIDLADCYRQLQEDERVEQLLLKAVEIGELIHQDRALALAHLSLGKYYEHHQQKQLTLETYLDSYYYARKIDHLGIINYISERIELKSDLHNVD